MQHHVEIKQLAIYVGEARQGPYMNVIAKDFLALGVLTHSHMQKTFLFQDTRGFIGLFAFPTTEAFNEYSEQHKGHWQEVQSLA